MSGRPDAEERARLAGGLGVLLRSLRTERGLSVRGLAARAAVSPGMVTMLEAGERRPRASLLGALAYGLDPDDPAPTRAALVAAAGESLADDTGRSLRRRRRRMVRGVQSGAVVLPSEVRARVEAHTAADEAYAAALRLLADSDAGQLQEADRLLAEARRLRERAGPPVVVEAGGRRLAYGLRFP
ncbi:helix-turn-helix transcriptional regulator [Actinoallomurus sp. NPDC052274]|uniref:helix-turn-helix domain-containing protein n=1 Tax=Actinoallomurus sp. NPDC052274 TaxID=3155420 RepID=UPI0034143FC1